MTLTNEDLDAIRKIVDDRAVQTEKLISMSFAQLGARISFMGQQLQFHPKSGNQLQFQQNNPWGNPNSQGYGDQRIGGWELPLDKMRLMNPMTGQMEGCDHEWGIAFRKLSSVEQLGESDFPKSFINTFNENFGTVVKFKDFINLSVADRTKMLPRFTMAMAEKMMKDSEKSINDLVKNQRSNPNNVGDIFGNENSPSIF